jgi:hypothetical protein
MHGDGTQVHRDPSALVQVARYTLFAENFLALQDNLVQAQYYQQHNWVFKNPLSLDVA